MDAAKIGGLSPSCTSGVEQGGSLRTLWQYHHRRARGWKVLCFDNIFNVSEMHASQVVQAKRAWSRGQSDLGDHKSICEQRSCCRVAVLMPTGFGAIQLLVIYALQRRGPCSRQIIAIGDQSVVSSTNRCSSRRPLRIAPMRACASNCNRSSVILNKICDCHVYQAQFQEWLHLNVGDDAALCTLGDRHRQKGTRGEHDAQLHVAVYFSRSGKELLRTVVMRQRSHGSALDSGKLRGTAVLKRANETWQEI